MYHKDEKPGTGTAGTAPAKTEPEAPEPEPQGDLFADKGE
jgi:hypothetical protein